MASPWIKFSVIFAIASALLLAGFFIAWYPHSVIEGLEGILSQSDLTQPQRDWYQGSLLWWQNQGVFTYESVANFVILSGVIVLVYAIVYSIFSTWRPSNQAESIESNNYDIRQDSEKIRKVTKTGFPIASGILTIISSSVIMLFSGIFVVAGVLSLSSRYAAPQSLNLLSDGLFGVLVFGFALTGGIMILKRKNFAFAIVALCFMVVKGATFIIANADSLGAAIGIVIIVLTVLSLIFTSISYKEFS
jgi:hypothetical protein